MPAFGSLSWTPVKKKKPVPVTSPAGHIVPFGSAYPIGPAGTPLGRSFKPFTPPQPPAGSYDPTLDVNLGAAQRGYGDLQTDISTQQARGTTDYLTGVAGIEQSAGRGYQDLGTQQAGVDTGFQRNLADLLTGRASENADYGTQTANIGHAYKVKAGQQLQAAAAGGLLGGSALEQAAAARARHQGLDQGAVDTTHQRFMDASQLAQSRLGEDHTTNLTALDTARGRLGQDSGYDASGQQLGSLPINSQLAQLNLNSAPATADNPLGGRSWQDLLTQLQRGGRETVQAGIDTSKIKGAEAAQAGWMPASGPKNEFVGPDGKHYQTHTVGKTIITVDQNGRIVSRKRKK